MHVHVEKQEARAAFAVLCEKLKNHAAVEDPAEIADAVSGLMREVRDDVESILTYVGAFTGAIIGLDDFTLRDLLLAGDTILVDFLTPDGPGRMAVELDEENPVSLVAAPEMVVERWQRLRS